MSLSAELVMTAHSSPIKALAIANYRTDHGQEAEDSQIALVESLISLDEAGEMAVWNCHDGRCLLHNLRATASGKAAGFATSISVSPNSEYCVVSGFSDKLVVLRLATLEIVQIVEVGGGREPRWVRSAGFLLQDDPNLLLDYLTLNFNAPSGESLTARQFDPHLGRFVSAACPILPSTLSPLQLAAFSSCHLLACSTFNPGLAALVTKLKQVWLIDFLRGDHTSFMLDFEVDGVEFVRADLLLIWSKDGEVAFYQLFLESKSNEFESNESKVNDSPGSEERNKSPLLGSIVRRLDVSCPFMSADSSSRLHLRFLPRPTQLLWMEVKEGEDGLEEGRACRVSIVQIGFDPASMDRTVYLSRFSSAELSLQQTAALEQVTESPVTCMIACGMDGLLQGHFNGQVSLRSVVDFFNCSNENVISTTSKSAPITALYHEEEMIVAGDLQGMLHFWNTQLTCSLGRSRAHTKRVKGIGRAGKWLLSWSEAGSLALHEFRPQGRFFTVHVFHSPTTSAQLKAIYFKSVDGLLILDYISGPRQAFSLTSDGISALQLSDSSFMESIALSEVKISLSTSNSNSTSTSTTTQSLMDGMVTVQSVGWPQLPCHSLTVDVRQLISLRSVELAKAVLSQLLAWGECAGLDELATGQLQMPPPHALIRYGLVGANGNVSSLLQSNVNSSFWIRSPTLTATLQLAILVLTEALFGEAAASLRSFYSIKLADDSCFKPASLSLISKFWQDPHPSVQQSARLIFSSGLSRLTEKELRVLIAYWKDLLPSIAASASSSTTSMNRGTIILAIIALQHQSSDQLPLKVLADSLVNLLLQEEKRSLFRLAAVELIGRGYEGVWRPFIHGQSIFRMLFNWYRLLGNGKASPVIGRTLLNILSAEPEILLQLLNDAFTASAPTATLLLNELLNNQPGLLLGKEKEIVELVLLTLKSEDGASLELLQRMTECFGSVAIGGRLIAVCCSSDANTIEVFDLKSKVKTATLAGHSAHSCTLLHFHTPKLLLSYSAGEAIIRWWPLSATGAALNQASSAAASLFFGPTSLDASSLGQSAKMIVVKPELTRAVDCIPGFGIKLVQARSVGDEVQLSVAGQILMQFKAI